MIQQQVGREKKGPDSASCVSGSDDWELVCDCRREKNSFFPLLMERHYRLVFNIAYRFFLDRGVAEDMAQDVFLSVYHEIDHVKPGKQPFVHWLCRVTSNCCRSQYRKRSSEKRAVAAGKVDHWYGDEAAGPAERIDDETGKAIEYVNGALVLLKPKERMALILSHIADLRTCQIAPMLKIPEYTVRRLLRRAEEKMRKSISRRIFETHGRS